MSDFESADDGSTPSALAILRSDHMTDDELYDLVRDNYNKVNRDYLLEQTAKACEYCPNNPRNGGSGVCHCLLGTPVVY